MAQKKVPAKEYEEWAKRYKQASVSINDRDELLDECAEELEKNFDITGSTAIEDRLQDGVP